MRFVAAADVLNEPRVEGTLVALAGTFLEPLTPETVLSMRRTIVVAVRG